MKTPRYAAAAIALLLTACTTTRPIRDKSSVPLGSEYVSIESAKAMRTEYEAFRRKFRAWDAENRRVTHLRGVWLNKDQVLALLNQDPNVTHMYIAFGKDGKYSPGGLFRFPFADMKVIAYPVINGAIGVPKKGLGSRENYLIINKASPCPPHCPDEEMF